MKYTIVFAILAVYLLAVAIVVGGWAWVLLWPATSFLVFAAAYAGLGVGVFAKRPTGRLAWWAILLMGPVVGLLWVLWHLRRRWDKEPACHEVLPGVWLGRRPLAWELPTEVVLVVDLAGEFPVARGVRQGREYHSLPILNTNVPSESAFRATLARVAECSGAVYVHCAQGHGRSAMMVVALLLQRGLAVDVAEAEAMLRQIRRGVGLAPVQRMFVTGLFSAARQDPGKENTPRLL